MSSLRKPSAAANPSEPPKTIPIKSIWVPLEELWWFFGQLVKTDSFPHCLGAMWLYFVPSVEAHLSWETTSFPVHCCRQRCRVFLQGSPTYVSPGHVGRACEVTKPDVKVLEDCLKRMAILDMTCACSGCLELTLGISILCAMDGFLLWKGWREWINMFNVGREATSVHSKFQ